MRPERSSCSIPLLYERRSHRIGGSRTVGELAEGQVGGSAAEVGLPAGASSDGGLRRVGSKAGGP